jgi:hypothetical protein
MVRGDQVLARQCYESSLKIKKHQVVDDPSQGEHSTNITEAADLDPREEYKDDRVSPIGELEEIQIGEESHQTTGLGTDMPPEERGRILDILKRNVDLFAWHPKDMPGIDESIITHKLAIFPKAKPISQ